MLKDIINYKGINIKKELYPIIKYIEDVDKYKDEGDKNWSLIKQLISNTHTGEIQYNPGKRWYQISEQPSVPITLYGTVTVK